MKKYVIPYIFLLIFISSGFLLFINIQKVNPPAEIDFIALNEITKQAALNWDEPGRLSAIPFLYRFTLIDNENNVRYLSDATLPVNLQSAVKSGFIPMDIIIGTNTIGKALIEVSPAHITSEAQTRLRNITLFIFVLLAGLNLLFLLVLHNALIKPFKRLQTFAHKITTGKLDEPLPMDKNNTFGLFTQSFDVMRESLLEAQKNQIKAERAKKELIASLNHDVKTPVTSIRLISELLQAGTESPGTIEKLKTIEIKADQIDRLMNDMMHSALEELGELKVVLLSEDSGILRDIFKNLDFLAKIRIGEIPACLLEIDRLRMEQIIGNIVTNSYKYADTELDIDCRVRDGLFQLDINDYGKGVKAEELGLITTKFYRGENAKLSQKEGEGLGLYIAKLLMDKMGGGLEAINRGDGFTVRLLVRLS
ncbi:MAG: HAMP domain-containing histidine kinase [Lachnospiraceae bacterium]|nr:HAMP domain-containing histidine kinase [Lachnospiraceae bacterium]